MRSWLRKLVNLVVPTSPAIEKNVGHSSSNCLAQCIIMIDWSDVETQVDWRLRHLSGHLGLKAQTTTPLTDRPWHFGWP